ncbi:Anaerobic dehydrogenases, typically selenocysteine-containing [hydrothermal vent metagenome]|uniref:Anaerobic dehydrogenases, typically selenocysteine-containing n=1 Tax=hydrothermal vent metagenome TaxID=652676 RepID=A0A1W1ECG1_9ZZZZ
MRETACPLDCYDACKIVVEDDNFKIKGDASHPAGNGALCSLLNKHMKDTPRIEVPRVDGVEVSMEEAMLAVGEAFKKKDSLLWKGSGNLAFMQSITKLFMEKIDGTLTKGSLCDGAGNAGILEGRGVNRTLPIEQIEKAEVVVVWGRNLTVTNSHIMPMLKGKKIVVIDPVKTEIAKKADYFLQIPPRTDYYLAIMLARFIFMEDSEDTEWLEEFASEYDDFYDVTCEYRIKSTLKYLGVSLGDMGDILNYLRNPKVVFLVGAGVQKYSIGASALHAIDSLAATLGLFGKEGCGVSYLGDSMLNVISPFKVNCPRVQRVNTVFSDFSTVLVQGGNPAESMPDSNRVIEELKKVENLIYFGLYENETSKLAKIVIPAKNFFEKEDLRFSYGHQYVSRMNKINSSKIGISEYEFTKELFEQFGFEGLKSEDEYIDMVLSQCSLKGDNLVSPSYEEIPYSNGFGKDSDDEFEFIEDFDDDFIDTKLFTAYEKVSENIKIDETFWLLSPKSNKSLNTQFIRDNKVQLHPNLGFSEGEVVKIISDYGESEFAVTLNEDIRIDCVLINNNAFGINCLTPSILSNEGDSACYQEVKIRIEKS